MAAVLNAEHEKSQRGKLRDLTPEQHEAVRRMHEAVVNKLLHWPSTRLREVASNPEDARALDVLVGALTELFELDSDDAMITNGESAPPRASKPPRRQERPATLDERASTAPFGDSR
jgi:hypothetical protein